MKKLIKENNRLLTIALSFLIYSCGDIFEVINPGPIIDTALDEEASGKTVLIGAISDVEVSANLFALYAGVASTDMAADATRPWVQIPSDGDINSLNDQVWAPGHLGRWSSEAAVVRLQATQSNASSSALVAGAYLHAGYANRLLADNVCVMVIDGGSGSQADGHYTRAIEHFNNAITIAKAAGDPTIEKAAIAGKAQCNLILGNYSEAAADAALISDDFLFVANRSSNSGRENNLTWSESHDQKQITIYGRPMADPAYVDYADPRTPMEDVGILAASGTKPFLRQKKYPLNSSNIPLAKGSEMRLIEAEVMLRDGNIAGCMEKINSVRTAAGVANKTATTTSEAWLALDQERHLVLWLEGRRLKDNVRFNGLSSLSTDFMEGRDVCFPPSLAEIAANKNLNWP